MPLYGVILGRLGLGGRWAQQGERRIDWSAAIIWVAGIVVFHTCGKLAPEWGAALPSLVTTFVLAMLTRPSASAAGGASALAQNRG